MLLPERGLSRKTSSRRRVPLKHLEAREERQKTKEEQKDNDLRATRKSKRWNRMYLGRPASRRVPVRAEHPEKRVKRLRVKRRRVKIQESLEKTLKPESEVSSKNVPQTREKFTAQGRIPVFDLVFPMGLYGRLGKHSGKYLQQNIPE